ncbi:MAG: hypothetical protein HY456_02850 [Parcubacteria group bacterium]|nr:hypothetical protein [Parcubacteria group bacterium]
MRNTSAIIIGIVGVIIVAVGLYFGWNFIRNTFFAPEEQPTQPAPASNLQPVSESSVLAYWFNGNYIYYVNYDGQVLRRATSGSDQEQVISQAIISSASSVLPSPDGTMAIIGFGNPQNPQFSIFHTATSTWQPLAREIRAVAWSPDGTQLAYLEERTDAAALVTSRIDGTQQKKILDLHILDAEINWVAEKEILILEKPSVALSGSIWLVDTDKGGMEQVASGNGLTFTASDKGGLLFLKAGQRHMIEFTTADAKRTVTTLPFVTLPEKCAVNITSIYCALPQNLVENPDLPDAYYKKQLRADDDIYKYDVINASVEKILDGSETAVDAIGLTLHDNQLFFINRYDSLVYSLKLK